MEQATDLGEIRKSGFVAWLHRFIDPATSLTEILFGLIMTLTFTLRAATELHQVGLINGYAKSSTDDENRTFDWYLGNRRIQAVTWIFDDGSKVRQELTETRELQLVDVPDAVTGRVVLKLTAVSAPGEGNAARDFTAISEVSFLGTPGS